MESLEEARGAARAAMAAGEWRAAVRSIGRGLRRDPGDAELLGMVDALMERCPDLEGLFQAEGGLDPADAAVLARIFGQDGQVKEAVALLLKLLPADPTVPYLRWAGDWLREDGAVLRLDLPNLIPALLGVQKDVPVSGETREQWRAIAALLARIRQVFPKLPYVPYLLTIALRDSGQIEESVALAEESYRADPGLQSAIALAGVYRDAGRTDEALAAYEEVQALMPDDPGPTLDMGDTLEAAGRHAAALDRYQGLLARAPDHPWALASVHYLRYLLGDRDSRHKLIEFWLDHPDHPRARSLARRLTPWIGYLPSPWEALIDAARAATPQRIEATVNLAAQKLAPGGEAVEVGEREYKLSLGKPEAPSAQLVVRRVLQRAKTEPRFSVQHVPEPDPREPMGEVRWRLWAFDDVTARPALAPPPSDPLDEAIVALASRPYSLERLRHEAPALAARCGEEAVPRLLARMVHPYPAPEGAEEWDWVPRVQIVCALIIAFIGEKWEGSARRDALASLIRGPVDWTVTAGAWAAIALAEADRAGAKEIAQWLFERLSKEPTDIHCRQIYPLTLAALWHPLLDDRLRRSLWENARKMEAEFRRTYEDPPYEAPFFAPVPAPAPEGAAPPSPPAAPAEAPEKDEPPPLPAAASAPPAAPPALADAPPPLPAAIAAPPAATPPAAAAPAAPPPAAASPADVADALISAAPPAAPGSVAHPAVAALASLFLPGLGHLLIGQVGKGILLLGGMLTLLFLTCGFSGFLHPLFAVDAYLVASNRRAGGAPRPWSFFG